MSLEAKIEALTVAVNTLTAKLAHIGQSLPDEPTKTAAPTGEAAAAAPQDQSKSTAPAPSEVTYQQIADAFRPFAGKNREAAVALLAKFGATKGPDLKPEQFADFYAELQKAAA